jgi:hypothetical protein
MGTHLPSPQIQMSYSNTDVGCITPRHLPAPLSNVNITASYEMLRFHDGSAYIVAYLLKARTLEPEKDIAR